MNETRDSETAGQTGEPIDPAALTVEQLARMLSLPAGNIGAHIAAGAPTDADGRINLVHYTAWLNRRLSRNDGD